MTPQEREVLNDAEQQAFESSQIESDDESTGVPKPPVIESTETVLEANVFGFEFAGQPTATAEPGASAPPPPSTCIVCPGSLSNLCLTFSGITLDCGCVEYLLYDPGLESVTTTGDPNGNAGVTASGAQPWTGVTGDTMTSNYYDGSGCVEPPFDADHETNTEVYVFCADGGGLTVFMRCGAEGAEALFLATVCNFGEPVANTLECGDFVEPLVGFGFGGATAVAHEGTVTIVEAFC